MRACIQRVNHAAVVSEGETLGAIGRGFLVLLGVGDGDTQATADKLLAKILKLRIFPDENGKTSLALDDISGELLIVSQFTLYADCKKGNRPSFGSAAAPDVAEALYEYTLAQARTALGADRVAAGSFGADMKVSLENDGPFTIWLDTDRL